MTAEEVNDELLIAERDMLIRRREKQEALKKIGIKMPERFASADDY